MREDLLYLEEAQAGVVCRTLLLQYLRVPYEAHLHHITMMIDTLHLLLEWTLDLHHIQEPLPHPHLEGEGHHQGSGDLQVPHHHTWMIALDQDHGMENLSMVMVSVLEVYLYFTTLHTPSREWQ